MIDDYRVRGLSHDQIEKFVAESRARNGLDGVAAVDIVKCLSVNWVWTVRGQKDLEIRVIDDEKMGGADAIASSDGARATIKVKRSVWELAKSLVGGVSQSSQAFRAKFTLAHELGHVVLCHEKASMARSAGVNAMTARPQSIPSYESAEHQANFFAGAFLIGRSLLTQTDTADVVSNRFLVGYKAAQTRLDQVLKKKSLVIIEGFKDLRKKLGNPSVSISRKPVIVNIVQEPSGENSLESGIRTCPSCGRQSSHPVGGNKFGCDRCQRVGDLYPDGDFPVDF